MCLAIHTTNISQFAATFNDARNQEIHRSCSLKSEFHIRSKEPREGCQCNACYAIYKVVGCFKSKQSSKIALVCKG